MLPVGASSLLPRNDYRNRNAKLGTADLLGTMRNLTLTDRRPVGYRMTPYRLAHVIVGESLWTA